MTIARIRAVPEPPPAALCFTVYATVFGRGSIKRQIQARCWVHGWDLTIDESRGWLESVLRFTIHVPQAEADKARQTFTAWTPRLNPAP